MKVEYEYERMGAWAYSTAIDVHSAKAFGSCKVKSGIVPFDALIETIMGHDTDKRVVFF